MSPYYAAVDLHSNQSVLVVIDEQDEVRWKGRIRNDLELILLALERYREQVVGVSDLTDDPRSGQDSGLDHLAGDGRSQTFPHGESICLLLSLCSQ